LQIVTGSSIVLAAQGRRYSLRDGERLIRWLTFQDVDRPPYYHRYYGWNVTHERWQREAGIEKLNLEAYFIVDNGFEDVPVAHGIFPRFERQVIEDQGEFSIVRDERGILIRQSRDKNMTGFIENPVKDWDDWETLKKERLNPDHPGRYHIDWDAFNGYVEATGRVARLGCVPYGVFGTPRDLMGTERLLIAFIDQPDLVHDMMDYLTDFWIKIYDRVTEHVKVFSIHIWEDMAGRHGSFISPKMVRDFMMPNYRKIKEFADAKCIPVISVDSDGDVSELVPIMIENGINFFWPFEVQAGCDIEEYRRKYPRLGIYGGLDKRALAQDREVIDCELARAERMLKHGGYLPGPDHVVPPDVPWDNFKYFMEQLRMLVGKK